MKLWRPRSISKTCEGLYCHGILVVELPYIVEAKARAEGCLLAGFFVSMVSCAGGACGWRLGLCGGG
jgi:hypothetical protein